MLSSYFKHCCLGFFKCFYMHRFLFNCVAINQTSPCLFLLLKPGTLPVLLFCFVFPRFCVRVGFSWVTFILECKNRVTVTLCTPEILIWCHVLTFSSFSLCLSNKGIALHTFQFAIFSFSLVPVTELRFAVCPFIMLRFPFKCWKTMRIVMMVMIMMMMQ